MRQYALVLLVAMVIGGAYYFARAVDSGPPQVAAGVLLEGVSIAGYTEQELSAYLDYLVGKTTEPALEAQPDSLHKGVIPGLAGRKLNCSEIISVALVASEGTHLTYIWEELLPEPAPLSSPIYQGNPHKRQITLVVNVAWGNDELISILDIFDEFGLKTTFFIVGRWADKFPELVQEIHLRGHEFGNHAYSDPHLPELSPTSIAEEITRTTAAILKAVGVVAVPYFSPPYNDFNDKVIEVAASLGYQTVLCSLDTADWMRPGVDRIVRRIVPNAHNGAIVLMHPTEQTPQALRQIIPALLNQGYELVPLGTLLSPQR